MREKISIINVEKYIEFCVICALLIIGKSTVMQMCEDMTRWMEIENQYEHKTHYLGLERYLTGRSLVGD